MDAYDRLTQELLAWGARSTAATEYSSIRTIDFANRYEIPSFDVEQLIEQMFERQWIDLCAWDGKTLRPFREWPTARAFWDSTEDGGHQRVKTLLDGKKRLIDLQGAAGKAEDVAPLPKLRMSPSTAIGIIDDCLERGTKLLIAPYMIPQSYVDRLKRDHENWVNYTAQGLQGIFGATDAATRFRSESSPSVEIPYTFETLTYSIRGGVSVLESMRLDLYVMATTQNSPENRNPHKIFIGHGNSSIWKDLRDFVRDKLHLDWEEFNKEPVAGRTTVDRLREMMERATFAFIVLTAEDEQKDGTVHARQNVIHEAGLFQGRLGFERAIVLLEDGCQEFSNIAGLNQIRFPRGNVMAVSERIRDVLVREKLL